MPQCPNCKVELVHRPIDPPEMLHCPICPFNMAPNQKKMDQLYAILSVDSEGREGLVATNLGGMPMPAVSSNRDMVFSLFENMGDFKAQTGMDCIIAKFVRVKDE